MSCVLWPRVLFRLYYSHGLDTMIALSMGIHPTMLMVDTPVVCMSEVAWTREDMID